jgi:hypothetical protein
MFLQNKYATIYEDFIDSRKIRQHFKSDFYEVHHIIPRSLGGSDDKSNLVKLTPKEHFFAHLLLSRITQGAKQIKMMYALNMMAGVTNSRKLITSKQYELAKSVSYRILQSAGKNYQDEKDLQNEILTKYTDINKVFERGTCKTCGIRPKAINYVKEGKTYYRSKCDVCIEGRNQFKVPAWTKEGYRKKSTCEKCGFKSKFSEQLTVVEENKKYQTICLNCQVDLKLSARQIPLRPKADLI